MRRRTARGYDVLARAVSLHDKAEVGPSFTATITWDDLDDYALERLNALLHQLPATEEHIIRMVGIGITQAAIGKALVPSITQAAVASRLRRAHKRVQWLRSMPPQPRTYEADLVQALRVKNNHSKVKWSVAARTQVVMDAVTITSIRHAALKHGVNFELAWSWVKLAKRIDGPTGQYVTHRLSSGRMMLEGNPPPMRASPTIP
jgi:hypothetical protein